MPPRETTKPQGQQPQSLSAPRPKRVKIDVACETCRARKVKCDGVRPACGNCSRKLDLRDTCRYSQNGGLLGGDRTVPLAPAARPGYDPSLSLVALPAQGTGQDPQSHGREPTGTGTGPEVAPFQRPSPRNELSTGPSVTTRSPAETLGSRSTGDYSTGPRRTHGNAISPSVIDSMTAVQDEGTSTREFFGSSSAGSFTAQIKKALDARLGKTGPTSGNGSASQRFPSSTIPVRRGVPADANYVLPTRRQADHLMSLYWQYVDPLYPFLDRPKWERSYHAIFAGVATEIEEQVFIATLNVIFAISTQLLESLTPDQRDEASNQFFQRAQDLSPLNVWDAGSVEQVQYLLLTSQYLQSTDHPHQTWMVVGSAARIAQGLGLHLPEASADRSEVDERELLRRIWHGCVLMDRVVAVTHGRPAMIPSHLAQRVPLPLHTAQAGGQNPASILGNTQTHASFFVKSLELYEIIYRTILSVYYSNGGGPLPKCVTNAHTRDPGGEDEDIAIAVQLDGALRKWEYGLPEHLKWDTSEQRDMIVHRQAVILHIRFLHARILLLRPFLSRFCISQTPEASGYGLSDNLQTRIIEQSALLCVDTAKRLIAVLSEFQTEDGTVGLLPAWWYRVYYVYTAATVLIAANLRPEIFPASVLGTAWGQSMSVLKNHEKFGQSARRCVAALHILSSKILQDNGTGSASGTSTRAGTVRATGEDGPGPVQAAQSPSGANPSLLLQPVDEFPFAFDDLDQLQLGDIDFDGNNLAWLNDMHATWELLNDR